MKKIIIALVVLFSANINAQIYDPVEWSTSVEKISETEYNRTAAFISGNSRVSAAASGGVHDWFGGYQRAGGRAHQRRGL